MIAASVLIIAMSVAVLMLTLAGAVGWWMWFRMPRAGAIPAWAGSDDKMYPLPGGEWGTYDQYIDDWASEFGGTAAAWKAPVETREVKGPRKSSLLEAITERMH